MIHRVSEVQMLTRVSSIRTAGSNLLQVASTNWCDYDTGPVASTALSGTLSWLAACHCRLLWSLLCSCQSPALSGCRTKGLNTLNWYRLNLYHIRDVFHHAVANTVGNKSGITACYHNMQHAIIARLRTTHSTSQSALPVMLLPAA